MYEPHVAEASTSRSHIHRDRPRLLQPVSTTTEPAMYHGDTDADTRADNAANAYFSPPQAQESYYKYESDAASAVGADYANESSTSIRRGPSNQLRPQPTSSNRAPTTSTNRPATSSRAASYTENPLMPYTDVRLRDRKRSGDQRMRPPEYCNYESFQNGNITKFNR